VYKRQIISIFLTGGVLHSLKEGDEKFYLKNFFNGCGKFFFRFLRLSVYMFIVHLVAGAVVYGPLYLILNSISDTVQSEATLFYILLAGLVIHLALFIQLLIITDYSRFIIFEGDSPKVLKSIWAAVKFVFAHIKITTGLFYLVLAAPFLLFLIYFGFDELIGMQSALTVAIMFILQQLFIWLRMFIRVWILGSGLHLYLAIDRVEES